MTPAARKLELRILGAMQDLDLLAKWRDARDATACAQLVNHHAGIVYATCRRVLGSESDAEDVAQECFEMLAEDRGAPREHVGEWLHRVATNRTISRRRSDSRCHARESRYSAGTDPDRTVEWDDIYRFVEETLGSLPDEFRHAIVATMLEGETRAAVAGLLGVSPSTVAYRIDKGVELIRGSLRKKGIVGARVDLAGGSDFYVGTHSETDADGAFSFHGLPPTVDLHIVASLGEALKTMPLELRAEGLTDGELVLLEAGTVAGLVINEAGEGLSGVFVIAKGTRDSCVGSSDRVVFGLGGTYVLEELVPGEYKIILREGNATYHHSDSDSGTYASLGDGKSLQG